MDCMEVLFFNTLYERSEKGWEHKWTLREALGEQDVATIKRLVAEGACVNSVVDPAFWDTPLKFAVRHSYLEVVEALVASPGCDVDRRHRNKHSALDEAVRVWLTTAGTTGDSTGLRPSTVTTTKQTRGTRFRVVRCLLSAGAKMLNESFLCSLVYSSMNCRDGRASVEKLVKVVVHRGHRRVKSVLLGALVSHVNVSGLVRQLIASGAHTTCLVTHPPTCHYICADAAVLLIKATNQTRELEVIEERLVIPRNPRRQWNIGQENTAHTRGYARPLALLVLAGHVLRLSTMTFLYKHHAGLYKQAVKSIYEPRPLRDLSRVAVRQHLTPNVTHAVPRLNTIPERIRLFILFED